MMRERYDPNGAAGVDWIAAAVGACAGALIAVVGLTIGWLTFRLWKGLVWLWKGRAETACVTPLEADSLDTQPPTASASDTTGAAASNVVPTSSVADMIRTLPLDGAVGMLHLRVFSTEGVVKPLLILREASLVQQHGRRIELAAINTAGQSTGAVNALALEQVRALIGPAQQANAHLEPISTAGSDAKEADNGSVAPPIEADDAGQGEQTAPPVPKAPARSPKVRAPRNGLVDYQGTLVRAGVERRTGVKNPYDCYCVTFVDKALDHEQQVWGTDLERAIDEAGVVPGDRVRIVLVGETPVNHRGRSSMKKIWSVEKVAA